MLHDWRAFGARLRQARKRAGMTGDQLGERLGVTKSSITHWEKGTNAMELSRLLEASAILDASLDWLIWGEREGVSPDGIAVAREFDALSPRARDQFRAALALVRDPPPPGNVVPIERPTPKPLTSVGKTRKRRNE